MTTKSLDEIFDEATREMFRSIELSDYMEESDFCFCYADHGFVIEGAGRVGGTWFADGDGYWNPRECSLKDGYGFLEELTVNRYDEETDEEIELSPEEIDFIYSLLEKELSEYMETY